MRVHTPALLGQVVNYMAPVPGKRYIDATLGAAGHTMALLEKGAEVTGIDRDQEIIEIATNRVQAAGYSDRFVAVKSAFSTALAETQGELTGEYDGVLFDLGVSSLQLDSPVRGFSFRFDAPLDMRMDKTLAVTAADLVNGLGKRELYELFHELGEEKRAREIANAITDWRKVRPIKTTRDLVRLVESIIPPTGRIHPATKIFQALRMAVNTEREELKAALPSALSWLRADGILAVISFHSLEDRIVQDFMTTSEKEGSLDIITALPVTPSPAEITANHRARSARMRVARRKIQ